MNRIATICAAGLGLAAATAAEAVTLNYTVTITDSVQAGLTGTGTLTFDETLLTGVGSETLGLTLDEADIVDATPALTLSIGGLSFDQTNDVDFPEFPTFGFFNGNLMSIDYLLVDGQAGTDLGPLGLAELTFGDAEFDQAGALSVAATAIDAAQVPLPAGLPLLLGALGVVAVAGRRRRL